MSYELSKEFPFKHESYVNGELHWSTAVLFTDEPDKNDFFITAGDWDRVAGDLDEWIHLSYSDATRLNNLLSAWYGASESIALTPEQLAYAESISNPDVKSAFRYLSRYFTTGLASFGSFRKLLDDNKITYKYSAYRSSSDW